MRAIIIDTVLEISSRISEISFDSSSSFRRIRKKGFFTIRKGKFSFSLKYFDYEKVFLQTTLFIIAFMYYIIFEATFQSLETFLDEQILLLHFIIMFLVSICSYEYTSEYV